MKFVNFAVVKFSVSLIIGILFAHFIREHSTVSLYILGGLFLLLIPLYFFERNKLSPSPIFGMITLCIFFLLGKTNYELRLPAQQKNHYANHISKVSEKEELVQLKIVELLKPDTYNDKYLAQVISIDSLKYHGKILVNIQKDSTKIVFKIDEKLLVSGTVQNIPKSLNPNQFEYAEYMKSLGVYGQIYLQQNEILHHEIGHRTLRGKAEELRQKIIENLEQSPIEPQQLSIIKALVLGEKRNIDKQLYTEYAAAGAVHILAVSGLHVGILYFILLLLFKPMRRNKTGIVIQHVLAVLILWGFAIFTGLSPSVTRAVTMFTFFAFAKIIDRRTSTLNAMFLSLLVLLLINPKWLFHVGFQLSYLAVFFILWLQPKLFGYWYPKNFLLRKGWAIFTVTIAAQLGVLPLSLYYFHQFPGLFLLTNLVILPWLGLILGVGIVVVILAGFNSLPNWIAIIYNETILWLNNFIRWVARQDDFLFQDISFSIYNTVALYFIIISAVLLWKKFNYTHSVLSLFSISIFVGTFVFSNYEKSNNQLVIFNKNSNTLVASKENEILTVFTTDSVSEKIINKYPLKNYRIEIGIDSVTIKQLPKYFKYKNETILVLDSLGLYPENISVDILLLTHSPKLNLERAIDNLKPRLIVADGNNYKSFVRRWAVTCKKKKLPFHYTSAKGAFLLE